MGRSVSSDVGSAVGPAGCRVGQHALRFCDNAALGAALPSERWLADEVGRPGTATDGQDGAGADRAERAPRQPQGRENESASDLTSQHHSAANHEILSAQVFPTSAQATFATRYDPRASCATPQTLAHSSPNRVKNTPRNLPMRTRRGLVRVVRRGLRRRTCWMSSGPACNVDFLRQTQCIQIENPDNF